MKKLILVGVILATAGISFTSCIKTCKCTTYTDGAVVSSRDQALPSIGLNCSDLTSGSTLTNGNKDGEFCTE